MGRLHVRVGMFGWMAISFDGEFNGKNTLLISGTNDIALSK